jgi:nucleotide-binding universal stress UspA family protein
MSITAIVSYDGTTSDEDALALARVLGEAGASLVLAYVRHAVHSDQREQLEEDEAEALLERGAAQLGSLVSERRVVVNASTSQGLKNLSDSEGADLIVFGSDYRTAPGKVAPQKSTQALLDGAATAVAIAPARYHGTEIRTIGLLAGLDDAAAIDTAHALGVHFNAEVTDRTTGIDLLIVGSRPEAAQGQVLVSAQAQNAIEESAAPVLVVARGAALAFEAAVYVG